MPNHTCPRDRRPSTRRLVALVAGSALALAAVHLPDDRPGRRPGVYGTVSSLSLGLSRDDPAGRFLAAHGKPMGWRWLAGVWSGRGGRATDRLVCGVAYRDGRASLAMGGREFAILW